MNAMCKVSCALAVMRVSAIVKAATVVQKAKELNYQQISLTQLANGLAMVQHPGPVVCPMNATPVELELAFD